MVEQVKAWRAGDGTIHQTRREAAEADARTQLKKLEIFNEATLNSVIFHAEAIWQALGTVVGPQCANLEGQ